MIYCYFYLFLSLWWLNILHHLFNILWNAIFLRDSYDEVENTGKSGKGLRRRFCALQPPLFRRFVIKFSPSREISASFSETRFVWRHRKKSRLAEEIQSHILWNHRTPGIIIEHFGGVAWGLEILFIPLCEFIQSDCVPYRLAPRVVKMAGFERMTKVWFGKGGTKQRYWRFRHKLL